MSQESQDANIKFRGDLNHPPLAIFNLFFLNRVHI
jgi:hypothetical protein